MGLAEVKNRKTGARENVAGQIVDALAPDEQDCRHQALRILRVDAGARYLRAGARSFISVISLFSFLGILLASDTIVSCVLNGFRAELLDKILVSQSRQRLQGRHVAHREFKDINFASRSAGVTRVIDCRRQAMPHRPQ